jgi:phosphoglucosamine mutase
MRLFGTDGIRGKVNNPPMTPEDVLKIGMAAAHVLTRRHGRNMIIIGKDTRLSGYMIESALTSGICSMGMNVTLTGPIPTPGIAFLTRALRQDAGIVISASHNPFEDNGIKFFSSDGFKLPDELEERIEQLVKDIEVFNRRPSGADIGKAYRLDDATGRYIEYIKSTIPRGSDLEGLKVVVDCANGAAYKVTPWVLRELGAEVITINDRPNGININDSCGSLHMEGLSRSVKEHNAHVGIAHDGDADRTLFCDEKGEIVDGDRILGLWAVRMKKNRRLRRNTVVSTVMSNSGLETFLSGQGIRLIRTKVGDRFVAERMIEGGYVLGGEPSGHIICLDYNTTGDGPITALQVLHAMKDEGRSLSELVSGIETYPQVLINVPVTEKPELDTIPAIMKSIIEAEKSLKNRGRVLVRPSGTENKIRVMVEAEDMAIAKTIADHLASVITKHLA